MSLSARRQSIIVVSLGFLLKDGVLNSIILFKEALEKRKDAKKDVDLKEFMQEIEDLNEFLPRKFENEMKLVHFYKDLTFCNEWWP